MARRAIIDNVFVSFLILVSSVSCTSLGYISLAHLHLRVSILSEIRCAVHLVEAQR